MYLLQQKGSDGKNEVEDSILNTRWHFVLKIKVVENSATGREN